MINEEILDKICPVPNEDETMEEIKTELDGEGFVINNFNKGGIFYIIIRIFVKIYVELKSLSRNMVNSLFIKHAEDDWLIIKAADFGKSRKEAVKTKGYITIHREEYENALLITKGHMFKTLPDVNGVELKYYAMENTVIGAGKETGEVLVEAEQSGTNYNVVSGKITVSMIHLEGVDFVTNVENWIYEEGADEESLESLRERVEGSWSELAERTTEDKLKNVAKKVSGVLDVRVDAQHPRGQGTTDIIVTGTNGEATQELLNKVEQATSYLKGNYDDWLYKSSEIINQNIELTIYMAKDTSTEGVKETAEKLIQNYMQLGNRTELNSLYTDDIRYILKDNIRDCKRVYITSPETDIELSNEKVVMLDNVSVTVGVIGGA